jgi:hypothetical protein
LADDLLEALVGATRAATFCLQAGDRSLEEIHIAGEASWSRTASQAPWLRLCSFAEELKIHRISCMNMAVRLAAMGAGSSMAVMAAACGANPTPAPTPKPSSSVTASTPAPMTITEPYSPKIDPAAFSTTIDNPYFPMAPGTRIIYQANTPNGQQRTTTEVTRDTKTIIGVATVVVHDTVTLNGKTTEDTFDWYALGPRRNRLVLR